MTTPQIKTKEELLSSFHYNEAVTLANENNVNMLLAYCALGLYEIAAQLAYLNEKEKEA